MSFSIGSSTNSFDFIDLSSGEFYSYDPHPLSPPEEGYSLLVHGSYEGFDGLNDACIDIAGKKVFLHDNYQVNPQPYIKDMNKIVQECFSPNTLRLKPPTPPESRSSSPAPLNNESYLSQFTSAIVTTYNKYFYDYDHMWKKVKYQLNLDMMETEYSRILKQWDEISETSLACSFINLAFQLDYNSVNNRNQHPREVYREFLRKLRSILESKEYLEQRELMLAGKNYDQTIHDFTKFCAYRFTSIYLYPFFKKLISKVISAGLQELNIPEENLENIILSQRLRLQFQAITACPQIYKAPKAYIDAGKFGGTANILFDPHMGSNMPYILYDLHIQWEANSPVKPIRCLRIGTPTQQRTGYANCTWAGEAVINPEFEAFIAHLASTSKTLLYISLQDDEERFFGEKARNDALRKLQEKYSNTFKLIILSQDSPFYHQNGEHDIVHDSQLFKENFIKELCAKNESNGYDVSEEFQDLETFRTILDHVHRDFFEGRTELTKQERCDFIEIAYTRFNLLFLRKMQPDYFIICCKDGMERAKKLVILLLYTLLSMWGKENDASLLEMLETYTHAAAFFIKKQAMIAHRRERMLSALEVMEAHSEAFQNAKSDYMVNGKIEWLDLTSFIQEN